MPPSPFHSGYFGDRVLIFAQITQYYDPSILGFLLLLEGHPYAMSNFFYFSVEMGLSKLRPQGVLEP
jgi:hypothetical protein